MVNPGLRLTIMGIVATILLGSGPPPASKTVLVGSLGDSISAAFNAQRYGDNRELS